MSRSGRVTPRLDLLMPKFHPLHNASVRSSGPTPWKVYTVRRLVLRSNLVQQTQRIHSNTPCPLSVSSRVQALPRSCFDEARMIRFVITRS